MKIGGNTDLKTTREKMEIVNKNTILDLTEALVDMFETMITMQVDIDILKAENELLRDEIESLKGSEPTP